MPASFDRANVVRAHWNAQNSQSQARPLWAMDLTPRRALQRPYGEIRGSVKEDRVPTAVDYRISPNGPVGSVGIVNLNASHAIDPP